jgi:hypothetical protein
MGGIFGGVLVPLKRDIGDLESSESGMRRFARHAVVDHFSIDLDRGMILLGPLARKVHGVSDDGVLIGIGRFLDCYHPMERKGLLHLLERLASEERPFHFTARLAEAGAPFVHGFVDRTEEAGEAAGEWSGVMIMSRSGLKATACFDRTRVT